LQPTPYKKKKAATSMREILIRFARWVAGPQYRQRSTEEPQLVTQLGMFAVYEPHGNARGSELETAGGSEPVAADELKD
jgi:hypothetical protein